MNHENWLFAACVLSFCVNFITCLMVGHLTERVEQGAESQSILLRRIEDRIESELRYMARKDLGE